MGAKKRKAARRKKKQKEASYTDTNQGNGDARHRKGSDGGELGSPVSQEHGDGTRPFSEGNGSLEIKKDVNNSMEGVTVDANGVKLRSTDKGVAQIVGELKHEEDSESKYIAVCNGHGNSIHESASVACVVKLVDFVSDEVSRAAEKAPLEEVCNLVVEKVPDDHYFKPVVSVFEEVIQVTHSAPAENSVVSDVVEQGLKENREKLVSKLHGDAGAPLAMKDSDSKETVDLSLSDGVDDAGKPLVSTGARTSNGTKTIKDSEFRKFSENQVLFVLTTEKAPLDEACNSVVEKVPDDLPFKPDAYVFEEVIQITRSATVENSVVPDVVEQGLKENGMKLLPKSEGHAEAPLDIKDSELKRIVDLPLSDGVDNAGKPLVFTGARTSNGTKTIKNSELHKFSENQPPEVSATRAVQKTSWMSCCGLFEVLRG